MRITMLKFMPAYMFAVATAEYVSAAGMDTAEQQHLSEDALRIASNTQFMGKADAMDAWLQQQYWGLIDKAQDITKDQDTPSQQSCPKLFAATEAGGIKPHELKLLCSQLHFKWQNESAKLAMMREKYASLLQDYRELEEQLDLAAACRHSCSAGCGTHSAAWTPEEVSVMISTGPICTVQHRATSCRVCAWTCSPSTATSTTDARCDLVLLLYVHGAALAGSAASGGEAGGGVKRETAAASRGGYSGSC